MLENWPMRRLIAGLLTGMLAGSPGFGGLAQAQQAPDNGTFTLKIQSEIVLTNVVVRDKKTGQVVKGLKASDFAISENGKLQTISTFDYQNVDEAAVLAEKSTVTGKASVADLINGNFAANTSQL